MPARDASGSRRGPRLGSGLALGATAALVARDLDLPTLFSYWGDRAPLVAGAALVFAALWTTRLRGALTLLTLALMALWLGVAFTPLTSWMARDLARRDPPGPGDAVFVLASRLQEDGEPTGTALARLVHGLELLSEGRARRLVLSELPPPQAPYAPLARTLMDHLRVEGELLTVGPVTRTHDEALALAALARQRGWRRVLIVTSPVHSRRASACFEKQGLQVLASPAFETRFDLETLTRPDERLTAFGDILHERLGLVVYRWRGWID